MPSTRQHSAHPGTALVTGASAGIGLQFCHALARRHYDLVLVARHRENLQALATLLQERYDVTCHVVSADLSDPQAVARIHDEVEQRGLHIDFLVNNAAVLYNGYFHELDGQAQEDLLAVNVVALTALTHRFLQGMVARRHGHILHVASTAAWIAIPQQNVYAASKAYVLSFSIALADEQRACRSGVQISALCPGYTDTRMLDHPQQGRMMHIPRSLRASAESIAEAGISACLEGRVVIIPGRAQQLSMALLQAAPRVLAARLIGACYRHLQKPAQADPVSAKRS